MQSFKKIGAWFAGPKSDLFLFVLVLILANVVGARAFFRIDLTSQGSYSLSGASRELVSALEEPVSIRVYFTRNLPAPYNSVDSYLRDLLSEYRGHAASKRLAFEFLDMEDPENRQQAQAWGLRNVQVQEVKDTEVGLKSAWMGLVILYGDSSEVLDNLVTTEGLEYRLTTTISRMIAMNDTLAGLDGKIQLTLYTSSSLGRFGIGGFKELPSEVSAALDLVNKRNRNRISFSRIDPPVHEVDSLSSKYALQKINWAAGNDGTPDGAGVLGLTLSRGDRFVSIPLELIRGFFGGYSIRGLDTLEDSISGALQSLLSRSVEMAYINGHGEKNLWDSRTGAARLQNLVKDRYSFMEYGTVQEVPSNVSAIMINGPRTVFPDEELYALDQFLMRGGNLFLLLDPMEEVLPDQQMQMYGAQPTYEPIDTGLKKLLSAWGLELSSTYVMDKACYVAKQQGVGEIPLYYVPQLPKEGLNSRHPVSKNLAYVLFIQTGAITPSIDGLASGLTLTPLASSSPESWIPESLTTLNPYSIMPPPAENLASRDLAVMVEGLFPSAYDRSPDMSLPVEESSEEESSSVVKAAVNADLSASRYLASSVQSGKVAIFGSSMITTPAVMDEQGTQPVSILVRNTVDWLNGNGDLIPMRTKGLSLNTLDKTTKIQRNAVRALNLYGLPALVLLAGLLVWRGRKLRRKRIRGQYFPDVAAKEDVAK